LPDTLADCASRWSLHPGPPFPNLTYNYVAPAVRTDGTAVVLKVGVPNKELTSEISALRVFAGRGAARLVEADPEAGALLLERVVPGTSLLTVADDEEATRIAARVMRALWRPVPAGHSFPLVADWAAGFIRLRARFDGGSGPLPPGLVRAAEERFAQLLATTAEQMVLHGDLHHDNILAGAGGEWRAIDPKGVVGEPGYEVGALLHNPAGLHTWPDLDRVLVRRLEVLAEELGSAPERLRAWAFAQAVLSAWWSVEDHGAGWEPAIALAERFAGLKL
jgi:streptomycin 6-kinase